MTLALQVNLTDKIKKIMAKNVARWKFDKNNNKTISHILIHCWLKTFKKCYYIPQVQTDHNQVILSPFDKHYSNPLQKI